MMSDSAPKVAVGAIGVIANAIKQTCIDAIGINSDADALRKAMRDSWMVKNKIDFNELIDALVIAAQTAALVDAGTGVARADAEMRTARAALVDAIRELHADLVEVERERDEMRAALIRIRRGIAGPNE